MKLLYRYANIPITLFLFLYLVESVIQITHHWYAVFFAAINLLIIILLNKYYYKTYLYFPFSISADNEKLICKNFSFSKKTVEIKHFEIRKISGGIFSGMPTRAIYLFDVRGNILIGFYAHHRKFQDLLKTILKNIPEDLYRELLEKMKQLPTIKKAP